MSDHVPSWMPSDETIKAATLRWFQSGYNPDGSGESLEPIRALLRAAVEKALAERMEKLVSDDGIKFDGWPEGTDMAREIEWAAGVILADDRLHRCVNFMVGGRAQAKVEKALAEREATYLQDFLGWKEQQEARHKREVLGAKIEAVRAAAKYSRDAASLEPDDDVGEAHTRTAERLDRMAASYAELAALDKGGE